MKDLLPTWVTKLGLAITLVFALGLWVTPARAGEAGKVFCISRGCGYESRFTIGGAKLSPALTGYCRHGHGFVRIKLRDWDDYWKKQYCPICRQAVVTIADGSQVSRFPCPRCGRRTLRYQRTYLFD